MSNPTAKSPLLMGFIEGLQLTEAEKFDRRLGHEAVMSTPSNTEYAQCYQVCPRTISRWRAAGVDLSDPVAVAKYLTSIKGPSPAALKAVSKLLAIEISNLTED